MFHVFFVPLSLSLQVLSLLDVVKMVRKGWSSDGFLDIVVIVDRLLDEASHGILLDVGAHEVASESGLVEDDFFLSSGVCKIFEKAAIFLELFWNCIDELVVIFSDLLEDILEDWSGALLEALPFFVHLSSFVFPVLLALLALFVNLVCKFSTFLLPLLKLISNGMLVFVLFFFTGMAIAGPSVPIACDACT